jgi:hypothetical protein
MTDMNYRSLCELPKNCEFSRYEGWQRDLLDVLEQAYAAKTGQKADGKITDAKERAFIVGHLTKMDRKDGFAGVFGERDGAVTQQEAMSYAKRLQSKSEHQAEGVDIYGSSTRLTKAENNWDLARSIATIFPKYDPKYALPGAKNYDPDLALSTKIPDFTNRPQ